MDEAVLLVEEDAGRMEILDNVGWERIGRGCEDKILRIGARVLRRKRSELDDMTECRFQRCEAGNCSSL